MTFVQDAARQAQATQNPLLDLQFLIPFDRIEVEHVGAAIPLLIEETRAGLEQLKSVGAAAPSFLADFDRLTERLDTAWKTVIHLDSVMSSAEWRSAKQAMMPLVSAFYTDLGMDTGLYAALKGYAATDVAQTLDPVRARFLKLSLDEFRRSGAELPEAERERLKALNIELDEVTSRYGSNVMDGISAFELYVGPERLAGVPERVRTGTLHQNGERQDVAHAGLHRLTLHAPTYLPIMTYAEDRSLREELYRAFNGVGTGEGRDNRELLPRILALRQEKAELLGYRNYADFLLEHRMAGSGQQALEFEEDLTARTRPAFERENAELEDFYRQQAGPDTGILKPWDISFWAEKQRVARYDLDDEELRPYFPIEHVLSGLYEIAHRLFGITVTEAQAPVWHPEVRFYEMRDEAGTHIASFYTDWFPRDSKRGGAWMNGLRTGGPAATGFVPHLGLMCGNLTPPAEGSPALLSHDEVETVFHEFGHLLHSSLSRVEVRELAGTHVAWDFVELPSHLMENWTWNREALELFAQHHQTGERLPDALYDRMVRARNFRAGNVAMRQYSLGVQDLSLHVRYTPADGDVMAYASAIAAGYQPTEPLEGDARIANFGHLFSSAVGYAAGYYSYKWAEVLEADAFTRFEREGVLNRQAGRALVDSVLSRGNGAPPEELFREFMGRDPDSSALLRRSGLDGETGA